MAEIENCSCNMTDKEIIESINETMLSASQIDKISTLFKVLGDPTRTKIVIALDNREVCVCTLADSLGMTKSAVSHQLAILKANNIVKSGCLLAVLFYMYSSFMVFISIISPLLFLYARSIVLILSPFLLKVEKRTSILSFSYSSSVSISSNI